MENDITYFGKTNFRGQEHIFGIKRDDRRRHMYVIGKTGMGKTTLLENMIISDIVNGNGLAVVDPHGDLAEEILNFIPANRVNDVVYFNPADIDYPIAFNVMEHVDPKYRHLVASGLIGVFKKIWADSWGPRLEYLLRNTILGLLEYPDSTLLGVPRMLIDDDYRKKVVSKISDPVVKTFWNDEFTKYSKQFMVEAISPIQNKVGQFLSSSLVRNIVSQPHSSIDMRDIMDNKKIFIVNLAKGRIGEDYSALLGAMIITKIQLAAMGRVDTPEPDRKDFYLYVDEFQNFATDSFAGILSEARKYRLDLIVAHQYIGQLEETVRDAIFGNVGTIVTFRVGATDAEYLEKEFEPIFMMNDLVNLAKYDMYLKLMIDGVSGDAFSASSLPPIEVETKSDPEKIIKVSRERYTKKREVVEDKVARWSGYIRDEENGEWKKEIDTTENVREKKERPDNREMWDATCATCGTGIKVPFQPDPSRPTYCKDCLLKVRNKTTDTARPSQAAAPQPAAEVKPAPAEMVAPCVAEAVAPVIVEAPVPVVEEKPKVEVVPVKTETPIVARVEPPVQAAQKAEPEVVRAEPQAVVAKAIVPEVVAREIPASRPTPTAPTAEAVKVLKQEIVQEKKVETEVVRSEVRQVITPKVEVKKPVYDPQKMIDFYERKRKEAEARESGITAEVKPAVAPDKVPAAKPALVPKPPVEKREAPSPIKPAALKPIAAKPIEVKPAVIKPAMVNKPIAPEKIQKAEKVPQDTISNIPGKAAREIKEGEVIRFN